MMEKHLYQKEVYLSPSLIIKTFSFYFMTKQQQVQVSYVHLRLPPLINIRLLHPLNVSIIQITQMQLEILPIHNQSIIVIMSLHSTILHRYGFVFQIPQAYWSSMRLSLLIVVVQWPRDGMLVNIQQHFILQLQVLSVTITQQILALLVT